MVQRILLTNCQRSIKKKTANHISQNSAINKTTQTNACIRLEYTILKLHQTSFEKCYREKTPMIWPFTAKDEEEEVNLISFWK